MSDAPFVSVIVPVFNDATRLATCLAALEAQTYPRDRYEVIVVDNGSTDGWRDTIACFPRVQLAHEAEPGSYAARNRGLSLASGEVLAFTDSDCEPARDWLAGGVDELARVPNCGLVGGHVELFYRDPSRPTGCELYESAFDFDQERFVTVGRFAMTANLFTTAAVMRQVGLFDVRLKSVGDRDWGNRVAASGYALVYAPHVRVRHPARYQFSKILAKRLRVAGGHHDASLKSEMPTFRFMAGLTQQLLRKPARGVPLMARYPEPAGAWTRCKAWGVLTALCYAEAAERLRLKLGGRSRR